MCPPDWYLRGERTLSKDELAAEHPGEAWVANPVPFYSILTASFFVTVVLIEVLNGQAVTHSLVAEFFTGPTFFVGVFSGIGMIEVLAGVSPELKPGPIVYRFGRKARKVGVYRIVLAVAIFGAYYLLLRFERASA